MNKPYIKLLSVCIGAVMLLCGCDTPKSGKPGSTDSMTDQLSVTPSVDGEGQAESGIIYDRCGIKLSLTNTAQYNSVLTLKAENTTDRKIKLSSVYIQEGDVLTSSSQAIYLTLDPKSSEETELTLHKSMGTLRMKLYLTDEEYEYIEGSLSDQIVISNYSKKLLSGIPLGRPVYEDDKVKLIYTGTNYNNNSNRVRLKLYAINKTDTDLYLCSMDSECLHKDYRFSMRSYLPANSQAEITATANSSNATISSAELDQAKFSLYAYNADDYIRELSPKTVIEAEDCLIKVPKDGRPETEIPTELVKAGSFEKYISGILKNKEYRELPAPLEDSDTKLFGGDISLEYIAGYEVIKNGETYCYLCFKGTNLLSKQIIFSTDGCVNGFVSDFYSSTAIEPMTEAYINILCVMPDVDIFGHCADVTLNIKAKYDDGHYDDASVISTVTGAEIIFGERPDLSAGIEKLQPLLSDNSCEARLLGFKKSGSYVYAVVFAQNKTDEQITVTVSPKDSTYSILKRIRLGPGEYGVFDLMILSDEKDSYEITQDDVRSLEFETIVK